MSYDDSVHWRARAKEMLARAEQMNEGATKHALRRVADAFECLARKSELEAKRSPPKSVSKAPLLTEARQVARRKDRLVARAEDECATEQVLRRVWDACECLARTAEQRAKGRPPSPGEQGAGRARRGSAVRSSQGPRGRPASQNL
jgi:hypothetical protein